MQGYIIEIKTVKDDDLIVSILTENHIYTTYRFYGARHSNINIGYKIDFELESNLKSSIPRLKDVIQLGFQWIFDNEKLYCWQRFIKLFYPHLKDVETIDDFYFNLLETLCHKMIKENSKRAICKAYLFLLEHEGRLHKDLHCFLCEKEIKENISLVRSFMPVHASCTYSRAFEFEKIKELLDEKSLIAFSDDEIDYLWKIVLQGL
ncbi:recombination protein RecO [Halarcobacter ebronensis]|uniref:Recombination protein RecO n=1 Tax=Halarcobacter ebronensis TaxID=1462615 RepID=A0A4Q1AJD6_9BACT|nr:recombination protein RecO [Halarcobacter ebronensis]QKF81407.1 putative RecO family recombination protein [Halarcobacter ebronensis]RXK01833.1 recombination protein RecO [Halarcobacter ebronensis]